jgi:hypothetical protein|tara:strand:- start:14857 stop:15363 length:507 start_codon:yes stop_codon:yes gene_type:complete
MIQTPVIGIPNWFWKKNLIKYAEKHPNIQEVEIVDFCHECSRHFQLLKMFDEKVKDFRDSEYYKYQRKHKRVHDNIEKRIFKFGRLYNSIKKHGCKEPSIVTDDGCRLNGSHRLAVLVHIGTQKASINVVRYEDVYGSKESKRIRDDVAAYRRDKYKLIRNLRLLSLN